MNSSQHLRYLISPQTSRALGSAVGATAILHMVALAYVPKSSTLEAGKKMWPAPNKRKINPADNQVVVPGQNAFFKIVIQTKTPPLDPHLWRITHLFRELMMTRGNCQSKKFSCVHEDIGKVRTLPGNSCVSEAGATPREREWRRLNPYSTIAVDATEATLLFAGYWPSQIEQNQKATYLVSTLEMMNLTLKGGRIISLVPKSSLRHAEIFEAIWHQIMDELCKKRRHGQYLVHQGNLAGVLASMHFIMTALLLRFSPLDMGERQQEGEFCCYFCTLLRSLLLGYVEEISGSLVEAEGVSNSCAADVVGIMVEQLGRMKKTGRTGLQDLDDPVYLF
ncbi:hypothetical protein N431DRAFT_486931 [Stipitochalara longipes BDJ]|nr:hypothetical protein N431DRAFT_486931 [Stipitochalara longipes BDJ]